MADRPLASPRPDVAPDLDGEPVSGVYPASRDFVREVTKTGLWRVGYAIAAFAAAVFIAGAFATRALAQTAHDAGVEAAKGHESRITALEQQVPQLRNEVYQGRLDTQALYKAVMDGKRQERLEQPPAPPPSPKDAGQ
jgi:hypothetical protein